MKKSIRLRNFTHCLIVGLALLSFLFSPVCVAEDWVYTVRKGDTLWDLCLEYTVKKNCWMEVGPYNEVDFPPSLAPGTRIRFPTDWLKNRPQEVELLFLRGDVVLIENGEVRNATRNERLQAGVTVQTEAESTATLLFADGSTLVMEENSELRLDTLSQHGDAGMVDSKLRLLKGTINNKVMKREPRSRFRVSTPSAVAAVRGTEFSVSADSEKTAGSVYDGEIFMVSQSDTEDEKNIQQGFGIVAKKGESLPEPVKLLASPKIVESFQMRQSVPATFEWLPVDGAKHYILQILTDSESDELLTKSLTEKTQFTLEKLEEKCYRLQLNAVAESGIIGMPTQTRLCISLAPKSLTAERIGKNEVLLRWQYEGEARNFKVDAASDADFNTILASSLTKEQSISLQLGKQKQLYFRVRSVDAQEEVLATSKSLELQENSDGWVILVFLLPVLLAL